MNFLTLFYETPKWVWALFIFLILRGLKALNYREMNVSRLFLLPLIFLFWGTYGVVTDIKHPFLGLISMFFGLCLGVVIGWVLWNRTPRLIYKQKANLIIRPGTPLTLIFILVAFFVKFALIAILETHLDLEYDFFFNVVFGFLTGVIDGIFWGGTLNLYFKSNSNSRN